LLAAAAVAAVDAIDHQYTPADDLTDLAAAVIDDAIDLLLLSTNLTRSVVAIDQFNSCRSTSLLSIDLSAIDRSNKNNNILFL
jgi:hypothetical protein